jgi:hypothetical protein
MANAPQQPGVPVLHMLGPAGYPAAVKEQMARKVLVEKKTAKPSRRCPWAASAPSGAVRSEPS